MVQATEVAGNKAMNPLDSCQRIVIKLGTSVVSGAFGSVERGRLDLIVRDVANLRESGRECLLVSSGAVGLGRKLLNQHERNDLALRQACASVGQNLLMTTYQKLFATYGLTVGQVLVTSDDLADRTRYLNLRAMLSELLALGVVPIMNENDSVSTMELQEHGREKIFGDNDQLSALVASKLGADALILLTDVDGVYDRNPRTTRGARKIRRIEDLDELKTIDPTGKSLQGRGGIMSKLKAVQLASMSGVVSIIASGFQEDVIRLLFSPEGEDVGTHIMPKKKLSARRQWIGFSSGVEGSLTINQGAQQALEESMASLLSVGITEARGQFSAGQVVSIQNEAGIEIGRGIVSYSSEEIGKVTGRKSSEMARLLQRQGPQEIVHRDRLIVFREKVS